jgi:putative membrane protein
MLRMMKRAPDNRIFWILNILFLLQWLVLSINVHNRQSWLLENVLVVLFAAPIIWAYRNAWISTTSYILLFVFLSLHNLGAHYTYSLVPYDQWIKELSGFTVSQVFGWQRNHYDRLLHFLFGFLCFLPLQETCGRVPRITVGWRPVAALLLVIGWSSIYELIEWLAAAVFSKGTGQDYVGSQGDPWDAQKDQALAIAGALLAWTIITVKRRYTSGFLERLYR